MLLLLRGAACDVLLSVGLFSWLADIFFLLESLLESRNMSAMYTWAKCLHFGSSELDLSDQCERTHPPLPGSGMAAEPPAKPPKEIPENLREDVDKLHRSVQVLLISKQIPWIVQAQMARDGYTTMEDLACRWTSADLARTQSPTDLKFKDGENGFDQQGSNFTAMRMYQAVMQAKNMFQAGMATGTATAGPVGSLRSNLDALCDRVALEKGWINQTGTPKPRLEFQGSDAFLKKQFKYCSKGEIGYFAPKHIVSALPEEGERPTKSHRKFTVVDGFEKEEEEEERPNPQTRRQLERMHTVFRNNLLMCMLAFPQFQQFDVSKSDLDEWYDWFYGPEIAGRKPPPSETTLLWAERNAWRQICQLMADGATLKGALKQMRENQLFWTREVYERIMFQQLRVPRDPKRKGKGKGKGKTKSGKGVYQDHLKSSPSGYKGGGKDKGPNKGGRPSGWPANCALQSPTGVPYCRDFHLKHSCTGNCNRSHACPVRVNGWTCNGDHSPDKCSNKGKPWTLPGPGAYSPQGPASGEKDPTNEEPVKAQTDGIHGRAPIFVPATSTMQFSEPVPNPTKQGASAALSPTPPDFSKVSPIPEAPLQVTGDSVTPPTTVQDLLTLFPWIASVPERLQQRLLWGSQVAPLMFEKPGQLLLYVGLSDEKSLDSTLATMQPDLKNHLLAFDIRREPDHDILEGQLYDQLCTHAWNGEVQGAGGGPNCGVFWDGFQNQELQSRCVAGKNQIAGACRCCSPMRKRTLTMTACCSFDWWLYHTSSRWDLRAWGSPGASWNTQRTPSFAPRVRMQVDVQPFGRPKQSNVGARAWGSLPFTLISASWGNAWRNLQFSLPTSHCAIGQGRPAPMEHTRSHQGSHLVTWAGIHLSWCRVSPRQFGLICNPTSSPHHKRTELTAYNPLRWGPRRRLRTDLRLHQLRGSKLFWTPRFWFVWGSRFAHFEMEEVNPVLADNLHRCGNLPQHWWILARRSKH